MLCDARCAIRDTGYGIWDGGFLGFHAEARRSQRNAEGDSFVVRRFDFARGRGVRGSAGVGFVGRWSVVVDRLALELGELRLRCEHGGLKARDVIAWGGGLGKDVPKKTRVGGRAPAQPEVWALSPFGGLSGGGPFLNTTVGVGARPVPAIYDLRFTIYASGRPQ